MEWSKYQNAIFNFMENSNESAVINAKAGAGKGGWVDSIIPTPFGDKRFGDLKEGDFVFDRNGNPTKILGVYPRGFMDAYKVTLSDGRSTICSIDHLWGVEHHSHRGFKYKVMSLEEILKKGYIHKDKRHNRIGSCKFYVPMSGKHHYLNSKKLPIHPYLLGVFIGNVCLREKQLILSLNDIETVKKVAFILNATEKQKHENNYSWCFISNTDGHIIQTKELFSEKDLLNKYSFEKEIPEEYLYSSIEDRISLLQGLFDTDGSVTNDGVRVHVRYSTTSNKLIKQVYNLLLSIGIVSNVSKDNRTDKYTNKECFSLLVKCQYNKLQTLFSLERKKNKCNTTRQAKHHYEHVGIRNIEKLPQQLEIQCIYVDNPDHLYLCEDSIVTHNTATIVECAKRCSKPGRDILFLAFNKAIASELQKRMANYPNVFCKTLHSHGYNAIQIYNKKKIKLDSKKWYGYLYDNLEDLTDSIFPDSTELSSFISRCLNLFDLCRINLIKATDKNSTLKAIDDVAYHHNIFEEYDEYSVVYSLLKIAYRLEDTIDFTDMIVLPCMHEGIKKCIQKYDLVFVDECQDLSMAQRTLLTNTIKNGGRFIGVGDENQSITGYCGSDCESFAKMRELANGKEFPLSVCYRCGKNIIDLAKTIVPDIEAFEQSPDGQVKTIKSLNEIKPGDVILSRKSAPTVSLCLKFIASGIPAKVKGRDILEGLTKLIEKSKAKTFEDLQKYLDKEYNKILKKVARKGNKEPECSIQAITFRDKIECIKYIADSCSSFSEITKKLNNIFSDYEDNRYILLSTIHKAKGLEWDRVFIILPEHIPLKWKGQQDWEYQQEMNLKYVAITRAKKELYIVDLNLEQLLNYEL